jgi:hypothetical protein
MEWLMIFYGSLVVLWLLSVYMAVRHTLDRSNHTSQFNGIERKDGEDDH